MKVSLLFKKKKFILSLLILWCLLCVLLLFVLCVCIRGIQIEHSPKPGSSRLVCEPGVMAADGKVVVETLALSTTSLSVPSYKLHALG